MIREAGCPSVVSVSRSRRSRSPVDRVTLEDAQQAGEDVEIQRSMGQRVGHEVGGGLRIRPRHDRVHLLAQPAEPQRLQRHERGRAATSRRSIDKEQMASASGDGGGPGEQLEGARGRHRRLGPLRAGDRYGRSCGRWRRSTASCSRRSSAGDSSCTASWRACISARSAGEVSHRASVSSPSAGARQRQQLEQRAAAEQIEIVRIDVTVVAEALAGLAAAPPAILDPRQPRW